MTLTNLRRPSPAMVVALLALFVALGGAAHAVAKAPKNSAVSKSIKKGAVRSADIHDDAVTGNKVADKSLTGADIDIPSLGLSTNYVVRQNLKNIASFPDGPSDNVTASCQPGERAIGGGAETSDFELQVNTSWPFSETNWVVQYSNFSGVARTSVQIVALVVCASQ